MKLLVSSLFMAVFTANPLSARTLAEAAALEAKELKAGCIVTAERIGDDVKFAIAGKAPEAKGTPPEQIVFEIGSITKVFTGLLLAQAVVEKKVTLETTVGSVLGSETKFADPRVAAITLEQLSMHTSGLPRMPTNAAAGMVEGDPYAKYDEKLLFAYIASAKLEGEGPYSSSYSNVGVGLLGHLLGKVFQTTWEDAVTKKICLPLGLNDTAVEPAKLPRATPHAGKEAVKPWHLGAMAGAGALRSNAADMLKFGEALQHPEKTPLKDAFAIALKPHAEAPSLGGQIGLGVFLTKSNGDLKLTHDGGTGGFCSGLQVIPAKGIVRVALISNNSVGGSEVIAGTSDVKAAPAKDQKEIALPAETMKQYPGVYELDRGSRFTVVLHDDKLWVRLTGQTFLPALAKAPDRFFNMAVAAEIGFNRDSKEHKLESLTLYQNGRELTAKRAGDAPNVTLRTAKELQPYAGEYALMGLKKLTVTVLADTLFAQLDGQEAAPVFETSADRFEYDVVKAALVFTRDDKKQINGLMLQQNGLTIPAARVTSPTSDPKK